MMFIIGFLLSLLGFAMAVAGVIGIISPKLLKDRKTGAIQTRGAWAAALVLGLVMFGGGTLLTGDDDKAKQTAADTQTETLQADDSASKPTSEKGYDLTINTPKKELPISFEELRQRINRQMVFYFAHGLIIGEFALGVVECLDVGGFAGFAAFLLPVLDFFVYP